ncbi:protein-S-isoprenylcysteine O-methyltransferase [Rhizomicrobium palustre]|uniref:Protein-S-isoprenylcysteine O-methyltransferase n=1 Tax=Rhizomicrobium palustre TaxID=189966 RepID=A0A846MYV8_9PROT|nr:isoprenylcysteine carboxylmethyltransferase family protein [Rhizomicrobium palustre]NIK88824.1 protein-S-isoprenylcysteine O-methyltransferase [Rhizomicrobium palustre]
MSFADAFSNPDVIRNAYFTSYWAWILMEIWIFSRDVRKGSGQKKDRGTFILICVLITAGITLAFWAPHLWPQAKMALPMLPRVWTAITLIWAGIFLRSWAVLTLGRHFRTSVRILDDHKLVTSGPYRVLRHPSYTGGLITVFGVGLGLGNWISLAAAFAGIFISYSVRILVEEKALREHFGEAFEAHAKRTWAVLPPLW